MNKQEAEKRSEELNNEAESTAKQCPIIKERCWTKACMCWQKSEAANKGCDYWYASWAGCNNVLITGSITVENYP